MQNEWSYKQKLIFIAGSAAIVAAVFLGVKYLFPLAAPFVIAYLIALLIEKPVNFLAGKLGDRKFLASGIIVTLLLAAVSVIIAYICYFAISEIKAFIKDFDYYVLYVQKITSDVCGNVDGWLGFENGYSYSFICGCTDRFNMMMSDGGGSQIMGKMVSVSFPVIVSGVKFFGSIFVAFISVIYLSKAIEDVRIWREKTHFRTEAELITDSLRKLMNVYFKVQALIMLIDSAVCAAGLMLIKNPYAIVLGLIIGVVDALPIFGTGTILIPWAIFSLLVGNYFSAAVLISLYLTTYFVREIMESKFMGDKLGIAPFTMLMIIFVGLMVYGLMGFILGPVSYCIIKPMILYLKTVLERGKLSSTR